MYKCLKITFGGEFPDDFLRGFIQLVARKYPVEGTAQFIVQEGRVSIIICGNKQDIDDFIDELHDEAPCEFVDVEIEPFLKEKDYRGVFRVIE